MIARAAQWNMSVFRPAGLLPPDTVVRDYLGLAARYDNEFGNTKFNVLQTLHEQLTDARGLALQSCRDPAELWALMGLDLPATATVVSKQCVRDGDRVSADWAYNQRLYPGHINPKTVLSALCKARAAGPATFTCITREKDSYFQVPQCSQPLVQPTLHT